MAGSYAEAVATLYQAPFVAFVAERKRLAGELKAAGDKTGAAELARLHRPTLASWAVNQLWWTARKEFEALFAAAQRLRQGDHSGTEARREALGTLRARATTLLTEASQAASDATLRRIATTLSALAAAGSFDPDAPGQLVEDRDPPGFESAGSLEQALARPPAPPRHLKVVPDPREQEAREARQQREEQEARERAAALERRRVEEEQRARRRAERERLERSLRNARNEVELRARQLERIRGELAEAERELEKSRATASQIEARLAALDAEE